jgi:hypothetical protein
VREEGPAAQGPAGRPAEHPRQVPEAARPPAVRGVAAWGRGRQTPAAGSPRAQASGTGGGDSVLGGRAGGPHDGTAGEAGSHTGRGNAGETGLDLGIFLRLLGWVLIEEAKRTLDIGEARKGFIVGATGLPLEPPTDPYGRAEWERGERVAMIIAIIGLLRGLLPRGPGGGPYPPQFAPSTAGGGAGGRLGPGGGYQGASPARPQAPAGGLVTTGGGGGGGGPRELTDDEKWEQAEKARSEQEAAEKRSRGSQITEPYDTAEAATGRVEGVREVGQGVTKHPGLIAQGYTETRYVVDGDGTQWTVHYNPTTGKYTGAHHSSSNE